MFTISQHQLDKMATLRRQELAARLTFFLRSAYASRMTAGAEEMLPELVERITINAPKWRFRYETDIAELAMLAFEMSIVAPADAMPEWFSTIMLDDSLSGPAKLYQLIGRWKVVLSEPPRQPAAAALRGMP